MTVGPPRQFQFQQHRLHHARRQAGQADDFVDRHRRGSQQADHRRSLLFGYIARHRLPDKVETLLPHHARVDAAHRFQYVGGMLDQDRAVADNSINSCTTR